MKIRSERSCSGIKFNNTPRSNWKLLMGVKFSKNSTKTNRLFILDFSIINMNNDKIENKTSEILNACVFCFFFYLGTFSHSCYVKNALPFSQS